MAAVAALIAAAVLSPGRAPASAAGTPQLWIGGMPTIGHTWLAQSSGWTPTSYHWQLDGVDIPGATSYSYVPPTSALNHYIQVVARSGLTTITSARLRVQTYNPLAGSPWIPPRGPNEERWMGTDFTAAMSPSNSTAAEIAQLNKIANRPRVIWLSAPSTIVHPNRSIAQQMADEKQELQMLIAQEQQGDPNRLVQIAVFGIFDISGGEGRRGVTLTSGQVSLYNQWITMLSDTLGSTRVMIWLEPDLALLLNPREVASISTRQGMVRGAAYKFSHSNPKATIYISAGDYDWPLNDPAPLAKLLKASGVQYARGFGLGDTHFTDAGRDIQMGAGIVKNLNAMGIPNRHYVIDTADTGHGFTLPEYFNRWHRSPILQNSQPCSSTITSICDALGTPPTWQILDTRLPLTSGQKFYAQRQLDGFLWVGRPWDNLEAWPFMKNYALAIARSSPYA